MYDGHTWHIQYLLNRLYGYNQDVDMVMVSDAMEQIVSEQSYSYQTLLKSYSAGQVRLLKAIARCKWSPVQLDIDLLDCGFVGFVALGLNAEGIGNMAA